MVARLLPKGRFLRGVSVLAGGTVLGQGLVMLASPILTRLYSPEDFGVLAVFSSLLGILAVASSLRYELAIPLPEDGSEAANILVLTLLIVVVTSSLSAVAIPLVVGQLTNWTDGQALTPFLWLLPIGMLLIGWYRALNYWAIREGAFGAIARTKVAQGVSSVLSQVSLGLISSGPLGLLIGQILGRAAGTTALAPDTLRSAREMMKRKGVSLRGLTEAMSRYRDFPLFSSWSALANTLSQQIPPLLLVLFFGTAVTGLYTLGLRVLQTPLALLGLSIGQVFFSRAAEAKRGGTLETLVVSAFGMLTQIGVPMLSIIGLSAPELFSWTFGPGWREAGVFTQWFTPWLILQFVYSPLSTLPMVLERQGLEFVFQSGLLGARAAALVVGGLVFQDSRLTIALYALASSLCYLAVMLWVLSIAGVGVTRAVRIFLQLSVANLYLLVPVALGKVLTMAARNDTFVIVGAVFSGLLFSWVLLRMVRGQATSASG